MPDRPRPSRARVASPGEPPPKSCAACGRSIAWRARWARDWESIRFCSDSCRAHKPAATDLALEAAILHLLHTRGRDKSICPSEAARAVAGESNPGAADDPAQWQPLMEPARAAARRLVAAGRIHITQAGHPVDPSTAKGPIRLRLA